MKPITWHHLKTFIQRISPDYFLEPSGIKIADIHATEQRLRFKLPQSYRDFLLDMGNDKAFNAFGRAVHDFNFLSSKHPTKHYPPYFFRIAHDSLNDLNSPIDLFIDLRECSDYDTTLFEYEPYGDFNIDRVVKLRLSLMEYLTRQVLLHFLPLEEKILSCYYIDQFIAFLTVNGFGLVLPPQPNLKYFQKLDIGFVIEMEDSAFSETLANIYVHGEANKEKEFLAVLLKKFTDQD